MIMAIFKLENKYYYLKFANWESYNKECSFGKFALADEIWIAEWGRFRVPLNYYTAYVKPYLAKKEYLRQLAISFQHISSNMALSYGELFDFQAFFEYYGKRYGLLREFRENAIC